MGKLKKTVIRLYSSVAFFVGYLYFLSIKKIPRDKRINKTRGTANLTQWHGFDATTQFEFQTLIHKIRMKNRLLNKLIPLLNVNNTIGLKDDMAGPDAERGQSPPRWYAKYQGLSSSSLQKTEDHLAWLALNSYSGHFLRHDTGNVFLIDFSHLDDYPRTDGTVAKGVEIRFVHEDQALKTTSIVHQGITYTKDHELWDDASLIARSSFNIMNVLFLHYSVVHFAVSTTFDLAVNRDLNNQHPLGGLLFPHTNFYSHSLEDRATTLSASSFPSWYGFDKTVIEKMIGDQVRHLSLRDIAPVDRAKSRGFLIEEHKVFYIDNDVRVQIEYPLLENLSMLYEPIQRHSNRTVRRLYPTREELLKDESIAEFVQSIRTNLPNGLWFPKEDLNQQTLTDLLSILIYNQTVFHSSTLSTAFDDFSETSVFPTKLMTGLRPQNPSEVRRQLVSFLISCKSDSRKLVDIDRWSNTPLEAELFRDLKEELMQLKSRISDKNSFVFQPDMIGLSPDK